MNCIKPRGRASLPRCFSSTGPGDAAARTSARCAPRPVPHPRRDPTPGDSNNKKWRLLGSLLSPCISPFPRALLGGGGRGLGTAPTGTAAAALRATATTAAGAGLALVGRAAGGVGARLEAAGAAAGRAALVLFLARLDEDAAVLDLDAALSAVADGQRREDRAPGAVDRRKLEERARLGLDDLELLDLAETGLERGPEQLGVDRRVAVGVGGGPVGELRVGGGSLSAPRWAS